MITPRLQPHTQDLWPRSSRASRQITGQPQPEGKRITIQRRKPQKGSPRLHTRLTRHSTPEVHRHAASQHRKAEQRFLLQPPETETDCLIKRNQTSVSSGERNRTQSLYDTIFTMSRIQFEITTCTKK